MKFIKVLKQQEARKGSLAEAKWKLIAKHDGKPLDDLKKAMEKNKIPTSRMGLSWHVRKEYVELVEEVGEEAPAKCKPAKGKGAKCKPCTPVAADKGQKFENLVPEA